VRFHYYCKNEHGSNRCYNFASTARYFTMMKYLRFLSLALVVMATIVVAVPARAAQGDYCQAAGGIPGHRNSTNQCIADEVIGQACGQEKHYDAKGDCVSDHLGEFCTASSGTRGRINAAGNCIAEPLVAGASCILPNKEYGHLDKTLKCVVDTACTGKSVGQLCDASGQIGHCDDKLVCIADAAKGTGDCVGKRVAQLCDANGQIGHCDDKLACIADAGGGAGPVENPTPGSGSAGDVSNPNSGTRITLLNPLGPINCTGSDCLMSFIATLLSFIARIGSVVIILALVYVGFQFVTAQDNPTKLNNAKTALQWTIIGGLILLGSQAIAMAIQATVQAISVGG
jgi:hypothetical protein